MTSKTATEHITPLSKSSDKTPPIISFFDAPFNGGTLKIDEPIKLHFNEEIKAGPGKIIISSTNDTREISPEDSNQVTIINYEHGTSTVIINPSEDFKPDTEYSLQIQPDAVKDLSDNAFPGLMNDDVLNFTTVPSNPIIRFMNVYDDDPFEIDGDIKVKFDEPIKKGSGDITISNGEDTRIISIDDADQVSFDESGFKINLTEDLIPFTKYTIQIDSGVVTDRQGNLFLGTDDDNTQLDFYTAPPDPPRLIFSNIGDDFNRIQVDGTIQLLFNEEVIAGDGNIVISNGTDTRTISVTDTQQVHFLESGNVAIKPAADFKAGTEYSIRMDPGAITDDKGHAARSIDDVLKFTPIPSNPVLRGGVDGHTFFELQNDENISLFFNEQVKAGSGNIVISDGQNTRTISINDTEQVRFGTFGDVAIDPTNDFVIGKTYSVRIDEGAITDLEGNPYAGIQDNETFNFTAISSIPSLQSTTPGNNDTNFYIDSDIKLNFSETVMAGEGDIIITNGDDVRSISVDDASQVTFGNGKITINPTEALIANTNYHVEFAEGVITDTKGNAFPGITDDTTLNFTTIPSDPVLVKSSPINGATTFDSDNSIRLNFNETVVPGCGNVTISNGSDTRTINIHDSNQIKFDYAGILINPTADLQPDTNYSIRIDKGAIKDESGFSYAGISNDTTLSFSVVADVTPPTLISSSPPEGGIQPSYLSLRFGFDDEIVLGSGNITISDGTNEIKVDINNTDQVQFTDGANFFLFLPQYDPLAVGGNYSLTADEGIVLDNAGHPFAGIQDDAPLHFTVSDPSPGIVTVGGVQPVIIDAV